jgi:hypothetical protein
VVDAENIERLRKQEPDPEKEREWAAELERANTPSTPRFSSLSIEGKDLTEKDFAELVVHAKILRLRNQARQLVQEAGLEDIDPEKLDMVQKPLAELLVFLRAYQPSLGEVQEDKRAEEKAEGGRS